MSEDHSEFQRGQISGLQHICALIVNHHAPDDSARIAFIDLLNSHSPDVFEYNRALHNEPNPLRML